MAKAKTVYTCSECGGESPKWQGQCPHCNAWNSLVESAADSGVARNRFAGLAKPAALQKLSEVHARELPRIERPLGVPETYAEYSRLMFDMQILAFQTDMTRVSSTMLAREQSAKAYPEIGVGDPHHPLTHHNGDPVKVAKVLKINLHHMASFAYFLDKMAATPDGDSSLLDRTMVVFGSAISDGNLHLHDNLPMIVLGGKVAKLKAGHHVRYPQATPLANLYLTLFDQLGIKLDTLGDSTGRLPGLTA